ncbi:unnamed protein product [Sphagnum troendelagicum]|uniref:Uncharacterized protein n=1 Tax=Sphagnum jensenii TaxID=128206 RepID=A0ABP0X924_9BRYO
MIQVMSIGTSVSRIGFYGSNQEKLWWLTHVESLSIWNLQEARIEADFSNCQGIMQLESASGGHQYNHVLYAVHISSLIQMDYLIHCHYAAEVDSLWLVAGTHKGTVGYFP